MQHVAVEGEASKIQVNFTFRTGKLDERIALFIEIACLDIITITDSVDVCLL